MATETSESRVTWIEKLRVARFYCCHTFSILYRLNNRSYEYMRGALDSLQQRLIELTGRVSEYLQVDC